MSLLTPRVWLLYLDWGNFNKVEKSERPIRFSFILIRLWSISKRKKKTLEAQTSLLQLTFVSHEENNTLGGATVSPQVWTGLSFCRPPVHSNRLLSHFETTVPQSMKHLCEITQTNTLTLGSLSLCRCYYSLSLRYFLTQSQSISQQPSDDF